MYPSPLVLLPSTGLLVPHYLPDSLDSNPSKTDYSFSKQTIPTVAESIKLDLPLMLEWLVPMLELSPIQVDVISYFVARSWTKNHHLTLLVLYCQHHGVT